MDEGSEKKEGDTHEEDEEQSASVPCIDVHAIRTFLGSNHCKFGTDTVNGQVSCSSVSSISSYPCSTSCGILQKLSSFREDVDFCAFVHA